jgi:hypothetical protein
MNGKAWRVMAVSLLTGFMIGMPGVGHAADGDDDDPALAALFEGAPAHPDRLFRVEWVASPGRPGRSRLEGSVHNDFGRTALNVQLRVIELDAAGDTVSTVIGPTLERVPSQGRVHFNVQVPDHRRSYRVAVGSFSFDFADPAAR